MNEKQKLLEKLPALRELHRQRKSAAPKLIKPTNPRFDDVYEAGMAYLEGL